jgi:hypothetical protein
MFIKLATEHGSCALRRKGGELTSVLSAEAFSPHKTHFCVLGSGIGLSGFVRALRGLMLLGIGGLLFVDLALRENCLS